MSRMFPRVFISVSVAAEKQLSAAVFGLNHTQAVNTDAGEAASESRAE